MPSVRRRVSRNILWELGQDVSMNDNDDDEEGEGRRAEIANGSGRAERGLIMR